jgi:hypothetical protein
MGLAGFNRRRRLAAEKQKEKELAKDPVRKGRKSPKKDSEHKLGTE